MRRSPPCRSRGRWHCGMSTGPAESQTAAGPSRTCPTVRAHKLELHRWCASDQLRARTGRENQSPAGVRWFVRLRTLARDAQRVERRPLKPLAEATVHCLFYNNIKKTRTKQAQRTSMQQSGRVPPGHMLGSTSPHQPKRVLDDQRRVHRPEHHIAAGRIAAGLAGVDVVGVVSCFSADIDEADAGRVADLQRMAGRTGVSAPSVWLGGRSWPRWAGSSSSSSMLCVLARAQLLTYIPRSAPTKPRSWSSRQSPSMIDTTRPRLKIPVPGSRVDPKYGAVYLTG